MRQALGRRSFGFVAASTLLLAAHAGSAQAGQVLLIPDTGADKIWAFDPFDGHLVSSNYIPADGRMQQVIQIAISPSNTLLMTDELADAVHEYSESGTFIRTFANAASGVGAPFGLAVRGSNVYVTNRTGANAGTVQRYDQLGNNRTTFITMPNVSGTQTIPRGIAFRANDVLVGQNEFDNIERFTLGGSILTPFHDSDGVTGIDFAQQLVVQGNGRVLAAGFSPPTGAFEYDSNGVQLSRFQVSGDLSLRGVFPLGNGNILYAGGTRVGVIARGTGITTDVVSQVGASFRFVTLVPTPGTASLLGLAGLVSLRRRRAVTV